VQHGVFGPSLQVGERDSFGEHRHALGLRGHRRAADAGTDNRAVRDELRQLSITVQDQRGGGRAVSGNSGFLGHVRPVG
jgi:hypothetical protein